MHPAGRKSAAGILPNITSASSEVNTNSLEWITHLVLGILHGILSNELKLNQLQQFVGIRDAVESFTEIFQSFLVVDGHESGESISFASVIVL